ncbi:MAG: hypothetical protein HQ549_02400 [Candidatus Omnitrophica bacterium]|nr:hypothetical protein [Candidatus Omnitrophota bacterium]
MLRKKVFGKRIFIIALLSVILLAQPGEAFARNSNRRQSPYRNSSYKARHRGHNQKGAFVIPREYISIVIGGLKLCYREGRLRRRNVERTIVVNVPNCNGSYTPIALRKYGTGYIGPQGEYYHGNPTVAQLRALYGR